MNYQETRSLPELFGSLVTDSSELMRKEIALARAEISEKIGEAMSGAQVMITGAVLALGAFGVLLAAIVAALAIGLRDWLGLDLIGATSLSAGIVGVIAAIIAAIFVNRGRTMLSATNLELRRTAASIERDADVVKEKL